MKIKVIVTLKNGVLDPQGKAIQQTLNGMGFPNVENVRQGKFFDIDINEKVKKQIAFEKNRKLNEFSRQYFKKVAINQQIE